MTKTVVIAIILIGLILASGTYYYSGKLTETLVNKPVDLNVYYAKKEDLLSTQQKLEIAMTQLNATIQDEIAKQEKLNKEVAVLSGQAAKPLPVTTTPQITTPKPAPIPQPVPRTRAS